MTEPAFVEVGKRADLPLYSWGPDWWSLLEDFAGVADQQPQRSQFDAFPDTAIGRPPQLLYPVETLPGDIRDGLRALATAIHAQDTPAGGIGLLCGMTSLLGKRTGALFAALPPLMREVVGDERVAVNIPLKLTGESDGRFPLHADLFPNRVLLNVFERPDAVEGEALLMPAERFLALLEQRISPEELRWLSETLSGVNCAEDGYGTFQSLVWGRSFSDELRARTVAESLRIRFGPGEGYWIHDGTWLHGRGYLSEDKATFSRLHRLTYATRNFHSRDVQLLSSIDLDSITA